MFVGSDAQQTGAFQRLDRVLHRYHRHPLLGYGIDHSVIQAGLRGFDAFAVHGDGTRRIEMTQSPVWDTALAVGALRDAGLPADHPALVRAADWLLRQQTRRPGDWAVRARTLPPGGWAFQFANELYPDTDDTAAVVLALSRTAHPDQERTATAIRRGLTWVQGMRSSDGGWGAFDIDNTKQLVTRLPFCDFEAITDPPTADVTAHVVETLSRIGRAGSQEVRGGVAWLLDAQEEDGPWSGQWGCNYIYGTGAAVPALISAGIPPQSSGRRPRQRLADVPPEHRRRMGRGLAFLYLTWPGEVAAAPPPPRPPGACSPSSRSASRIPRPRNGPSPG